MKKIKALSLLLALVMVVSAFVGCAAKVKTNNNPTDATTTTPSMPDDNNEDPTEPTEDNNDPEIPNKGYIITKEDFVRKMTELLNLSLYEDLNESEVSSVTYSSYSCFYSMEYANRTTYDLDCSVALGDGTEFTMPVLYGALEQKGWTLRSGYDPNQEVKPGMAALVYITNTTGQELLVHLWNPTEQTITLKECIVIIVGATQYDKDQVTKLESAIDFTVCDSLTNASTLEDIVARLGNPTSVYFSASFDSEGKYRRSTIDISYSQKDNPKAEITFSLSGDGNYIIDMRYSYS